MSRPIELASLLLISTAMVAPSVARAQTAPAPAAVPATTTPGSTTEAPAQDATPPAQDPAAAQEQPAESPEVSVPGGADIVVVGTRNGNVTRTTSQVISVLSSADIARTGEGDIAGALARVTGLSIVGNGFVYVRGLGDRYSLALLNGSPLPSPEPLKRSVPLDIFPTNVIASSLVQKTYSANFPGEFGGGVINLTTKSTPKEPFFNINSSIGADTATTGSLGYTYFGSASDWTGFGNGARTIPPALSSFLSSGQQISDTTPATQRLIASQLFNGNNSLVQRNQSLPPNWGLSFDAGKSWDVNDLTIGLVASFGYSNKWRTRDNRQQTTNTLDLSGTETNFQRVITDNRIVVDGLIGGSLEFDRNKIRWTTLYVRDTLKQARLGVGTIAALAPTSTFQQQDTAWFARQLIDTQLVGEFKPTDKLSLDLRGGFANSRRDAPNEIFFQYQRSNNAGSPTGQFYLNPLNGQFGDATLANSFLRENLYSAGLDLTYKFTPEIVGSLGYAYTDTYRQTERRSFQFRRDQIAVRLREQGLPDLAASQETVATGLSFLRPDALLSPSVINAFGISINENSGTPVFGANLVINAGYGRLQWDIYDDLNLDVGLRYETAQQSVNVIQIFQNPISRSAETSLNRDYFLPAITLTYKITPEIQFRIAGSKTISRPQFRELIDQSYTDPEVNRQFRGNARLTDTQLYNAEARLEWYFARDQRISVAGFYKRIDNPIEVFTGNFQQSFVYSFANAPTATLFGGEIETQKYFDLENEFGTSKFFATRRLLVIANYTYTNSRIQVGANDPGSVSFLSGITRANQLFRDGVPLTGQSDHIANLELGLEDRDGLSQQTLLLNYASRRATIRAGALGQPDVYEYPGFHLDFVARQGVRIAKINTELKFEVRNITGTRFQEYQDNGTNRITYNDYNVGTTFNFGVGLKF